MKLSEISVRRPITTVMFFCALVLLGVVSVERLPLQLLPDISPPYGAAYCFSRQNMSPEELEQKIIRPIEGEIAQLPNVKNIRVYSHRSGAFFHIEFEFGTNVKYRIVDLQERLDSTIRKNFPPRSVRVNAFPFETAWVNKDFMDLVLKGPRNDPHLEYVDTERTRQQLQDIDGVAQADIWGGRERSVDVNILQDKLQEFGIPFWRVINTVRTYANEPVFLGDINEHGQEWFVRLDGQFKDESEISSVVVKDNGNINVNHLGTVEETSRARRWLRRVDGQPALGINLEKEAMVNPIELSYRAHKKIDEINESLPNGYALAVRWEAADDIMKFLRELSRLALMGVILSMLVLYMFIRNLRMALVVCVVIPICIITTFNAMYFSNMSINIISLLGLAVGVGTLIDSSIVVLENVFRHHEKGKDGVTAALVGTHEVGQAVFALTLTNVIVFLPIIFIDGEIRLIFTEGALAIIYPMVISMLVALTLVPMATSRVMMLMDSALGRREPDARPHAVSAAPANALGFTAPSMNPFALLDKLPINMKTCLRYYSTILKACLRHRVRFLIAIVLVVAYTCVYSISGINRDVMDTPEDNSHMPLYLYLPEGTKQDYTLGVVERVEDMLMREVPERKSIHAWVQDDFARFEIELKPQSERDRTEWNIREDLRPELEKFTEAELTFNYTRSRGENSTPPVDSGRGGIVEIRGPEYEQLNTVANNFAELMMQIPDIRDVAGESEEGSLEVQFTLDRDAAALLQVTPNLIAQSIQVAQRRGDFAQIQMKKGDDEIDILFNQIPDEKEMTKKDEDIEGIRFEELKEVQVFSPSLGTTVPLEELGKFEVRRGLGSFQRENRERITRVRFETAPNSNYSDIEEGIKALIQAYPAPAGYRISLGGKSQRIDEGIEAVKTMGFLALTLNYMCIAALFESFSMPLVILLSVPLATIGIVWGFILTGNSFTELAGLGLIFLIGILPNSPIILIHFANYLRRYKNYPRTRAIMVSGSSRLRPIFMTVLTTNLGLMPMAFSWKGDENWVPFAVCVISGLTASTILTLIIVPGFYFIVEDVATLFTRITRYIASWRWVFVFWSKKQRLAIKEDLTAYRVKPPREEPLTIEIDHLTRIYSPSLLERMSARLGAWLRGFKPMPASPGFIPNPPAAPATTRTRTKALDMISMNIESGLFGLLGPNGAGKSTLLRLLAGVDQPTRGYLSICGYDMKTEARKAQKLIGYLPQEFGVYGPMTAFQYLDYFALLKGIKTRKERREAIHRALEQVNLSDQLHTPVGQFSGGMMRRIGLAQILLRPPKVLIVDEPTAGLDPMERVRFRNLLARLARDRVVILSTHIVEDVAHSCKTLALLFEGKVLFNGSTESLIRTVEGKVWEWTARGEDEWREARKRFAVAGQHHTAEGFRLRVLSDESPADGAVQAEPTLEDAYLLHTRGAAS
ncbi:MAG: ATP-binding cassette domain-containing protein [bacterium]|nr:ATP-binding cassette domain-containing protein [bacterium]